MQTFAERKAITFAILTDPDCPLSVIEGLVFLYHWYRFEQAIIMRRKANRSLGIHGAWLNQNKDVYVLRKELNDL